MSENKGRKDYKPTESFKPPLYYDDYRKSNFLMMMVSNGRNQFTPSSPQIKQKSFNGYKK